MGRMPRLRTEPLERTALLDALPTIAVEHRPRTRRSTVLAYVALTKPRIIELLLVSTIPTMFVAARGMPGVWLMVCTLVGGTLAAGGANAINMVVDVDIDTIMKRTQGRPLVTGAMTPRAALVFAIAIETAAFAFLWSTVNLLSAVLAVAACLFYVFIYTLWLKRTSSQNIVIGGAAGAVPVLVGWSAVTNRLDWAPIVLFAVIFVWTPPHFWALAVKYREDYSAANVPMLPSVATFARTVALMVRYTVVMWALTVAFYWVGDMGPTYLAAAVVLGGVFLWQVLVLQRTARTGVDPEKPAMRLFGWSITYLTLLFAAMAVDQLLVHGF
jgi:heme o synthase